MEFEYASNWNDVLMRMETRRVRMARRMILIHSGFILFGVASDYYQLVGPNGHMALAALSVNGLIILMWAFIWWKSHQTTRKLTSG